MEGKRQKRGCDGKLLERKNFTKKSSKKDLTIYKLHVERGAAINASLCTSKRSEKCLRGCPRVLPQDLWHHAQAIIMKSCES